MTFEAFLNYAEFNFFCMVIFLIMLGHGLVNADRREKQIKYNRVLLAFILYFFSDLLWAGILAHVIPENRAVVIAANLANIFLMALITYTWLHYVMAMEEVPNRGRAATRLAIISPFIVSTLALIITFLIRPQILIDEQNTVMPIYSVFQIGVPIINIGAVLVFTMRKAKNEKIPEERKKHLYIGLFPLVVIGGGILQVLFFSDTPIFCCCSTILMLVFYIYTMEGRISVDPLTGLNNRGQLHRFITQRSGLYAKDCETYVMMVDVNDFKKINDTYGHAEGDRALIMVAEAIRSVAADDENQIFLARYGGDEFILILSAKEEENAAALAEKLRERIGAAAENGAPFTLTVGIGYEKLAGARDSFQKCIQRADLKMYLDKERVKNQ